MEAKNKTKFILFSAIGIFLFLIPIPYLNSFTIPVGILIDAVKSVIHDYTLVPLILFIVINAIFTVITVLFKPKFIMEHKWLSANLNVAPLYVVSRVLGAIFAVMYYFQVGPQMIIDANTGGVMIDLTRSLISVLTVISFTMPLLTEFGIMEFVGILVSDVVRPLFKVPGRSDIDLITSWFGASSAAVLLTKQQYDRGYYTGREAGIIMTNFSFVSIPFCYIVANVLDIVEYFTPFYLISTLSGIIIAMILPRIYPLKSLPEDYNPLTGKQVDERVPQGVSKFRFAVERASERASKTTADNVIRQGADMFLSVIFSLSPIILAWGTISLILVEFTPIFTYLAYPMGYLMKLLGIPMAMEVGPATLVGFADMFIPPLLLAKVSFVETRFIVGAATLLQLIYLTEVGAIIIQSDVPLGFKDLLVIFLERTVLALVLVTLFTKLIMSF